MTHPDISAVSTGTTTQLRCIGCGNSEPNEPTKFRCSKCDELLEIHYSNRKMSSSPDALKRIWKERRASLNLLDQSGVWRYRELLPIVSDVTKIVSLREGNTPVYELTRCARSAGVNALLAKHQGMNPTGSFKDTGMTAALSVAREKGFEWVVCASTGNTSASMAAYAARANMRSLVLIPEGKISWGKLSQSLEHGALTLQLRTDFDGCMKVLTEVVQRFPIYVLNSLNPYRVEGQKTVAVELLEQLDWQVPDHVIVPGGNLANCSALGKGFRELHELGMISSLPKVSVIQAEGANPLVRAMRENNGEKLVPVNAETLATAIRIGNPASWRKAVTVLKETGGTCEDVNEHEIAEAKAEIGADGVGCEPASAATLAGLKKLVRSRFVKHNQTVVLILTGHLLKDSAYTLDFHRGDLFSEDKNLDRLRHAPQVVDADEKAILRILESSAK